MGINERPLVSVIIPTYNRVSTLPDSLNSVLNQTWDALEVIIVDDGSDDATEEYVRGVADKRIRYTKNTENKGPSAARNRGVELAQGEYVAFHDSDDEWMADKLEKQMELFRDPKKEIDMVYCEFTRYHGSERQGVTPSKEIPYHCKCGRIFTVLLLQPLISPPTMVVKRRDFIDAGGFNEALKTYEDYEFSLRFSRSHVIGFVEESLVKVHDSPDSVNMRYADRIRTQAYIVKEMITPMRACGLLGEKLSAMQREAEVLKCHGIFAEELHQLMDLFVTEQEKQYAMELLEKTGQRAREIKAGWMIKQELSDVKQQILKAYLSIYSDDPTGQAAVTEALHGVRTSMTKCMELFQMPGELQIIYERTMKPDPKTKLERLFLLTELVAAVETAEAFVEEHV